MESPLNPMPFIMLLGCILLMLRNIFLKHLRDSVDWLIVLGALSLNLVVGVLDFPAHSISTYSNLFNYSVVTKLSNPLFSLHCLLVGIGLYSSKIKFSFNFLISMLLLNFFAQLMVSSDSFFFFPIYLFFYILLIASVPFEFSYQKGVKCFKKGIIYAFIFLFLGFGIQYLLNYTFGSIVISDLSEVLLRSEQPASLYLILSGFFLFLSLAFISPFNFFDSDYEIKESWLVVAYFRASGPLLSALLICKWYWLENWGVVSYPREGLEKFLLSVAIGMLLLGFIEGLRTKSLNRLLQGFLLVPIGISFLTVSAKSAEGLCAFILCLVVYIFCNLGFSLWLEKNFVQLDSSPGDLCRLNVDRRSLFTLLLFVGLLLPPMNQVFFSSYEIFQSNQLQDQSVLTLSFFLYCVLGLYVYLFFAKLAPIFQTMKKKNRLSVIKDWGYIDVLLIPLLILSFYPELIAVLILEGVSI